MTTLSAEALAEGDDRLPLHQRLSDLLIEAIRRGEFGPSTPLPPESEIARRCDIAVGTVRKAMDNLTTQGVIVRQQGRGTFVRRLDLSNSLLRFFRFGREPTSIPNGTVLSSRVEPVDGVTRDALHLPLDAHVLHLERLRFLRGDPMVRETLWLPLPLFDPLRSTPPHAYPDLLYPYYESTVGVMVTRATEDLTVVAPELRDVELLDCAPDEPVVEIQRVARSFDGSPVERRISRGPARTFHYRVEIS